MVDCWRGLDEVPAGWAGCAVTIGVFDGVHRGHQHVLGQAAARAREDGTRTVAVTFDPRPVDVLAPDKAPPAVTSLDYRVRLLGESGADAVLVLPFSREFAGLGPEEFVQVALVERLRAGAVVVGEDFRFGHRASGDVALLQKLGERYEFTVEAVAPVGAEGATYSSSRVRERVADGDVDGAARILGRPHRVEGIVVRGDGRGRELGYPTANISHEGHVAVPADGIYAGWLMRPGPAGDEERLPAAISVGTNPTFSGTRRQVEAYALDRDDLELYQARVAAEFVTWLRGMSRFDFVDGLLTEMDRDVRRTRDILGTP